MYETETQRLQREADAFTQKLEQEKRRLLILEDQCNQVRAEIADKKDSIKKIKPNAADERKANLLQKTLENQLAHEVVKLNQAISKNKNLRLSVNVARKELMSQ